MKQCIQIGETETYTFEIKNLDENVRTPHKYFMTSFYDPDLSKYPILFLQDKMSQTLDILRAEDAFALFYERIVGTFASKSIGYGRVEFEHNLMRWAVLHIKKIISTGVIL